MLADSSARCPFVHTPPQCVCFFGHEGAGSDPKVSVSAHVAIVRVRKRTRGFRFSLRFVRFCTRSLPACALSDTEVPISPLICPFLHTPPPCVCRNGHGSAISSATCPFLHASLARARENGHVSTSGVKCGASFRSRQLATIRRSSGLLHHDVVCPNDNLCRLVDAHATRL